MYTAVARQCTRSVHAVNGRVHGHIHGTYTAVHTGRKHGRLHGRKHAVYTAVNTTMYTVTDGLCTWPVHCRVHSLYTAVRGRVQSTDRVGVPCTWPWTHHVHGPCTPVYMIRTRPCTGYTYAVRFSVHGLVYGPCTRPFTACTDRVHRRARAVYMVRPRPCTGYTYTVGYSVYGRAWSVHDPNTAVYTVHPEHGRVP